MAFLTEHPLANGFPISAGKATVKMPTNVPPRDDYFVVREFKLASENVRTFIDAVFPSLW